MTKVSAVEREIRRHADGRPISQEFIVTLKSYIDSVEQQIIEEVVDQALENHREINARKERLGIYQKKTLTVDDYPNSYTPVRPLEDADVDARQENQKGRQKDEIKHSQEVHIYG